MMGEFQYVYVLENRNGLFYTGCTSDPQKRLAQHKEKKSFYTKDRGPYKLIYFEACLNAKDAYNREKYLKSGAGKKYINNRIKNYKGVGMNPVTFQKTFKKGGTTEVVAEFQTHYDSLTESGKGNRMNPVTTQNSLKDRRTAEAMLSFQTHSEQLTESEL